MGGISDLHLDSLEPDEPEAPEQGDFDEDSGCDYCGEELLEGSIYCKDHDPEYAAERGEMLRDLREGR